MTVDPATPAPSLQRRVTALVLGLLAVLLLVLGVVIDVSLRAEARRDLNGRLLAATSRADALALAHTPANQMAAQLSGGTVRALVVTADGAAYGGAQRPTRPAAPKAPTTRPANPLAMATPTGWRCTTDGRGSAGVVGASRTAGSPCANVL
ncbi:two-component regulator-sensor kinase [Mycobacterium bohemicum DSM 44277]|uniref:Two-component regulator-sensor kinase n=1 Tax=Mycobacterium bohemicum DSM 44277 TaxID=1236609 RepID=A0A0U0W6I4_MYCBE|nr:two-component regulator-sensor kinase [Mycobacterium bohemicum DSM 44277]